MEHFEKTFISRSAPTWWKIEARKKALASFRERYRQKTPPNPNNLLDLLVRIIEKTGSAEQAAEKIGVSRAALYAWRNSQEAKPVKRPLKPATAEKIKTDIRRVAVELGILPR